MRDLVRWNPIFDSLDEAEKIFNDFLPALRSDQSGFVPAIDMYEDKNNIIVETQLAGIQPENVQISIDNDTLALRVRVNTRVKLMKKIITGKKFVVVVSIAACNYQPTYKAIRPRQLPKMEY